MVVVIVAQEGGRMGITMEGLPPSGSLRETMDGLVFPGLLMMLAKLAAAQDAMRGKPS